MLGGNKFSISEIIRVLGGSGVLKCVGYHSTAMMEKESSFAGMDHWAPSAAAIDLEVNRETGELRMLRYSVIADAGKALHYPSAKAQVDGGAVMGFGHALFEETIYQEGPTKRRSVSIPLAGDAGHSRGLFIPRCWRRVTGRAHSALRVCRKPRSSPSRPLLEMPCAGRRRARRGIAADLAGKNLRAMGRI